MTFRFYMMLVFCVLGVFDAYGRNDVSMYYFTGKKSMQKVSPFLIQNSTREKFANSSFEYDSEYFDALLSSDDVGRPWSSLVRALDFIEDGQLNYRTSTNMTYYLISDGSGSERSFAFPGWTYTLADGVLAGAVTLSNENSLAVMDDGLLWLNAGTLCHYSRGGFFLSSSAWTTFTGGELDGVQLVDALQYLIGAEGNLLYFMKTDSFVMCYRGTSGKYESALSYDVVFPELSDLGAHSFADVVDGSIEGFKYLGWSDNGPVIVGGSAFNRVRLELVPARFSSIDIIDDDVVLGWPPVPGAVAYELYGSPELGLDWLFMRELSADCNEISLLRFTRDYDRYFYRLRAWVRLE